MGGDQIVLQGQPRCLGAVAHSQFGEDIADVEPDRARADRQRFGDLFVGPAFGQQGKDLALSRRQVGSHRGRLHGCLGQDLGRG